MTREHSLVSSRPRRNIKCDVTMSFDKRVKAWGRGWRGNERRQNTCDNYHDNLKTVRIFKTETTVAKFTNDRDVILLFGKNNSVCFHKMQATSFVVEKANTWFWEENSLYEILSGMFFASEKKKTKNKKR